MNTAVGLYRNAGGVPGMVPALGFEPRVPPPASDRVDLRLLFAVFRRRLGVFLAVMLAVLAAGLTITALQPRTYTARAEVTLNSRPQTVAPTTTNDGPQQAAIPSEAYVDRDLRSQSRRGGRQPWPRP